LICNGTDMYNFTEYTQSERRSRYNNNITHTKMAYTINKYDWYTTTIHQTKYSRWSINNCGAGTLGQEKWYMHINVFKMSVNQKFTSNTMLFFYQIKSRLNVAEMLVYFCFIFVCVMFNGTDMYNFTEYTQSERRSRYKNNITHTKIKQKDTSISATFNLLLIW
jgi:hypothetical protein